MKIAVLADIHSNYIALQVVNRHVESWQPDYVVVLGDIINRGPKPFECLNFVKNKNKHHNWIVLCGNHEEYVIDKIENEDGLTKYEKQVHRPSLWTGEKIFCDLKYIKSLPVEFSLSGPDFRNIIFMHGSMLGSRNGIYPETNEVDLKKKVFGNDFHLKGGEAPAVFCVGHTHRPFITTINNCLVINAGSVGLSFDGDPRLAYAQLEWKNGQWDGRIIRLDYSISEAENDFYTSGYFEYAGPLVRIVRLELKISRSLLYYWASLYQEKILNGEISLEDTVDKFLSTIRICHSI